MERGLYIVPTPIGNLSDISLRAIEVLKQVTLIAAEDTRHSQVLLSHLGISTPMVAHHEHSAAGAVSRLLDRLRQGESVALITGFVAKEIVVSTYGVLFGVGEDVDESNHGVIAGLRSSGMTPLVALSFLVFTLLYTPCLATVAAIKRETGTRAYTLFSIGYSLGLAYLLAYAVMFFGGMFNWLS